MQYVRKPYMPNYGACLLRKRFDDMSIMARVAKNKQTDDNIFVVLLPAICSLERRARYLFYCMFFFVCSLFCQRFFDNPRVDSRQILHAGVLWFRVCLLLFGGQRSRGRKKGEMKFSLLQESMGNFCILVVFVRYLSNAWTDPHQILYVQGQ